MSLRSPWDDIHSVILRKLYAMSY